MATTAQSRAAYRHLWRNVTHAVGYKKAAVKNMRRLLGDDVRTELGSDGAMTATASQAHSSPTWMEPGGCPSAGRERRVSRFSELTQSPLSSSTARATLLLYLAASQSRQPTLQTPENLRLHRLVANLSSLCYHHLSPHTVMQPNERSRRVGGTDAPASRRLRSRRAEAKGTTSSSDSRRIKTDDDDDDDDDNVGQSGSGASVNAGEVVTSLIVPGKRPRGPKVGPTDARVFFADRWNGQSAQRFLARAEMADLEKKLEELGAELDAAKESKSKSDDSSLGCTRHGSMPSEPATAKLVTRIRETRGRLKAERRLHSIEDERQAVRAASERMLADAVTRAQYNAGAWLGAARFEKLARKQWLAP